MQVFTGLERWGREHILGAAARVMPTSTVDAREAGELIARNPSAKILLIGIYPKMGQFLCATPLLRSLKTAWPRASFHLLGNPANAAAARTNPHLGRVWVWRKSALWQWPAQLRALRNEHFDLALLLTTEQPSATGVFLARMTGARWVAGYAPTTPGVWAKDAAALCHIRIPFGEEKNETKRYLGLGRAFGAPPQGRQPEFVPSAADEATAGSFFSSHPIPEKGPRVGLFIGGKAERSDRLWPVSHFARLADSLKGTGLQVIALSPPPPEHLRFEAFRRELSWTCPVLQETSLGCVAAFIKRLDLLVCPDGGILHLAAAVGTPSLGLFFSTDPEVWGHEKQTIVDGRGKPSSALRPEAVAAQVFRILGVPARQ